MGKPSSGGTSSGGSTIFTTTKSGSGSFGTVLYVDLGVIPSGWRIWFGTLQFLSGNKSGTCEVRTSLSGYGTGTDGTTRVLAAISSSRKTVTLDMYKSGSFNTVSVVGTGLERFWLKLTSTSATLGSFTYSLNYTLG